VVWAFLRRDATVVRRELAFFLMRTAMQPLMVTVVFGFLLPRMGFVNRAYTSALLPGVLAVSLALAAVQSVALPMVADFGYTREIEDRLLAPVPNWMVALAKVLSGAFQAVIAALFVLPLARLIMGPIPDLSVAHIGWVFLVILFGYTLGGFGAGRLVPQAALSNGLLAGVGAFVLWLPVRIVIWLVRDENRGLFTGHSPALRPGQIFGHLVIAAALGMFGGFLGARSINRAANR